MSTKTNPGAFRCYEAALPDEPMFVILGRDPAAPATLEFWAAERIRRDKCHDKDDKERIKAAYDEAQDFQTWRDEQMSFAADNQCDPIWKQPRIEAEPPPVYQPSPLYDMVQEVVDRIDNFTANARLGVVTAAFLDHLRRDLLVGCIRGEKPHEQPTENRRPGYTELADKIADDLRQVMREIRDTANHEGAGIGDTLERFVERLRGCAVELEAHSLPPRPVAEVIISGLVNVNGIPRSVEAIEAFYRKHETMETLRAATSVLGAPYTGSGSEIDKAKNDPYQTFADNLKAGEKAILDSAPEDLAHAPEVPPHRFSQFHKADNYAYARGLEINPTHLPKALDAMLLDGWELVSLFGATDSQNVGFIFKRLLPPAGMHVQEAPGDKIGRWLNGAPMSGFMATDTGYGRGQEP